MVDRVAAKSESETVEREPSGVGIKGFSFATFASAAALMFSGYSLWSTSLQQPELRAFVPPVIHYAAPYQNNNFEVLVIPVTLTNEGARTGTVLSMELAVTDPRTQETKRFYAADFGRWSMERTRTNAYSPFAPMSLAGRASRTETVLFYTRGEQEKPPQLIREPGSYRFKLVMEEAVVEDLGVFDRLWKRDSRELVFDRELKIYDARAFNTGTLPMFAKDWKSSVRP